jgi:glucose uptake protein GlcU
MHEPAGVIRRHAHLHDHKHALLGIVGEHGQALPGLPIPAFLWDYILGLIAAAAAWGMTLGSLGGTGVPFLRDVAHTSSHAFLLAMASGATFNIANLLLVAAIEIAGLTVAFPLGVGVALVVGAVSNYVLTPKGNPFLLFGGVALVVCAIVFDATAYACGRLIDQKRAGADWSSALYPGF